MLTYIDAIILGLIQGISEFLPISSSAHIVLAEKFLHIHTTDRTLEISLHMGTFLAVLFYFFPTFYRMLLGLIQIATAHRISHNAKLLFCVIIGTLPAVVIGYVVHMLLPDISDTLVLLGCSSIVFGFLLFFIDKIKPQNHSLKNYTYSKALFIGFMQCFALIPGASRLGMTLIGARLLGFSRSASLIFSYWLSVPVVLGAITLNTYKLLKHDGLEITLPLVLGILVSFLVGLGVIHTMIKWIERNSFAPIMLYRILFGIVLIYVGMHIL